VTDGTGTADLWLNEGSYIFATTIEGTEFKSGETPHCTIPGCSADTIVVSFACSGQPNGTPCDDGNACKRTDTCQSGVCVGTNPVSCTASG